jgi:hypothetical protein
MELREREDLTPQGRRSSLKTEHGCEERSQSLVKHSSCRSRVTNAGKACFVDCGCGRRGLGGPFGFLSRDLLEMGEFGSFLTCDLSWGARNIPKLINKPILNL